MLKLFINEIKRDFAMYQQDLLLLFFLRSLNDFVSVIKPMKLKNVQLEGQITDFFRTPFLKSQRNHIQKSQNHKKSHTESTQNHKSLKITEKSHENISENQ